MTPETAEPLNSVDTLALTQRWSSEGRWQEIQPVRDLMFRECRQKGMDKAAAQAWTYAELEKLYPPLGDGVSNSSSVGDSSAHAHAREGIAQQIPADWPPIPDNAALAVELAWVQSNRLRVVEGRTMHLDRAGSPAPSWAALGWLDTAISNPAKWADICAKGLGQQELESDITKRERRSIAEVRALLREMRATK